MRRLLFTGVVSLCLSVPCGPSNGIAHGQVGAAPSLQKYLLPANITMLDWLLLRAQVGSFTQDVRWDEYGVITGVDLYAIKRGRGLVGVTFLLKKQPYIALSDDTARKLLADAVVEVCDVLKYSIPEVEGGANVYATFQVLNGDQVGEYKDGRVSLKR